MIYCVVPPELEEELYEQLLKHYEGNPNVSVIIDRREGPDRRDRLKPPPEIAEKRQTRDRRRPRITGTFPKTDIPE